MGCFHVEAAAGDVAAAFRTGFSAAAGRVDLDIAAADVPSLAVDQAEAVIASAFIDFADGWPEVMEILIGASEGRINGEAALSALEGSPFRIPADLLMPAVAALPDPGRGHDMVDLDPPRTLAAASADIAAGFEVELATGIEGAAAIECSPILCEDLVK